MELIIIITWCMAIISHAMEPISFELISNASGWQTSIFHFEPTRNVLRCAIRCYKRSECDLFVFEDSVCYLGDLSWSYNFIDETVMQGEDVALYVKPGNDCIRDEVRKVRLCSKRKFMPTDLCSTGISTQRIRNFSEAYFFK